MRKLAAFVLLIVATASADPSPSPTPGPGPTPTPPPFTASERRANTDPYQEFPRWHAFVNALNKQDSFNNRRFQDQEAIASDARGLVHVVGLTDVNLFPGSTFQQIGHLDNRNSNRRGNGFADVENVSGTGAIQVGSPDIVATDDGATHILWEQGKFVGDFTVTDIFYRRKNADGSWTPALSLLGQNLTNNPSSPGAGFLNRFSAPRIAKDGSGNLHVVFNQLFQDTTGANQHNIWYAKNPHTGGAFAMIASGNVNTPDYPLSTIKISAGSLNADAQIAWEHVVGAGSQVRTMAQTSGAWGSQVIVASTAGQPDLGVDSTGAGHFIYRDTAAGTILYKKTATGTLETVSTGASQTGTAGPQIVLDSRDQANAVWVYQNGSLNQVAYALRSTAAVWTRQEPIPELQRASLGDSTWPILALRVARDLSDRLVLVADGHGSGLCSWTYEPNLGGQDTFGMFPWGPNASVNVATGNVTYSVNCFAGRGLGFAASFGLVYNSLEPFPGDVSRGWTHTWQLKIVDSATGSGNTQDALTLSTPDGQSCIFRFSSTLGYSVTDDEYGYFVKIQRSVVTGGPEWVTSTYTLTTKTGIKYLFDSSGRLTEIDDAQSPTPNKITFHYAPGSGLMDTFTDSTGRITTLTYDTQNRLTQVQDAMGRLYNFTYTAFTPAGLVLLNQVKYTSGPSTPTWKFEYWSSSDTGSGMKAGLLKNIFTPRGQAASPTPYFWGLSYWPDGRASASTEPSVSSIVDETNIDASPVATQAQRQIGYTDPAPPFAVPNTGGSVPKAEFVNRRGYSTFIEYEYKRSLADKITDAQTQPAGAPGVIQRYFDGYNFVTPAK